MAINSTYLGVTEVYCLCILLSILAIFAIVDYWKNRKEYSIWRPVLQLLALISLLLAILKPSVKTQIRTGTAVVLTSNYPQNILDSLHRQYPDLKLFRLEGSTMEMHDWFSFLRNPQEFEQVFILGCGLKPDELKTLSSFHAEFHPCSTPSGVYELQYPSRVQQEEVFQITGSIFHSDSIHELAIHLPSGKKVIAEHLVPGINHFQLGTKISSPGKYLLEFEYNLGNSRNAWTGKVPIEIIPTANQNYLLLESSPSFEVNYLKNLMAGGSMRLATRRQISRDVFNEEFFNLSKRSLVHLNRDLLDDFEIFIVELDVLSNINAAEKQALLTRVRNGASLLVLGLSEWPGQLEKTNPFFNHLDDLLDASKGQKVVQFRAEELGSSQEFQSIVTGPELAKGQIDILDGQNENQPGVFAFKPLGLGQLFVHILPDSYHMILEGKHDLYARFWREIIQWLQTLSIETSTWEIECEFPPVAGEPVQLSLFTNSSNPQAYLTNETDSFRINFRQSYLIPDIWTTGIWPRTPGWHVLRESTANTGRSLYIYPEESSEKWNALLCQKRIKSNQLIFDRANPPVRSQTIKAHLHPVPRWIFYAAFVLFLSIRWIIEKI